MKSQYHNQFDFADVTSNADCICFSSNPILVLKRNMAKGIRVDFRRDDSLVVSDFKPCEGLASVKIASLTHIMKLEMSAPLKSFGTCLRGPVESGFEKNVVETFVADIHITIHQKKDLINLEKIEDMEFQGAAFEFGRQYLCQESNPCSPMGS